MWLRKRDALLLMCLIEYYISNHPPGDSVQLLPVRLFSCSPVGEGKQKPGTGYHGEYMTRFLTLRCFPLIFQKFSQKSYWRCEK
jgi:hypothetical protein